MKVNSLLTLFDVIETFFSNNYLFIIIINFSLVLKFIFLIMLIYHLHKKTVSISPVYKLITGIVFFAIIPDTAWIVKLCSLISPDLIHYAAVISYIRIAWISFIIQYDLMGRLIQTLTAPVIPSKNKYFKLSLVNVLLITSFTIVLFYDSSVSSESNRWWIENHLHQITSAYLTLFFIPYILANELRHFDSIPLIVKKQLKVLLMLWVIPQVLSDFIHINPFNFENPTTQSYTFVAISTILLNFMIYFCARHIIRLRFLNFKKQVEHTKLDYHFDEVFQQGLIELGAVTTLDQLGIHVQNFFLRLFLIPQRVVQTHIHLNDGESFKSNNSSVCQTLNIFNTHLQEDKEELIIKFFHEHSIAIRHELEFNNFYSPTRQDTMVLELLSTLNIDLIAPIMYRDSILGYISVQDQENQYYSFLTKSQQKATIIFASYLGTFAHILQNKRLERIETRSHAIENQLFESRQQLSFYQEGTRAILQNTEMTATGLFIYCKNNIHCLHENIFKHYLTNRIFIQTCSELVAQNSRSSPIKTHERTIKIDKINLHCMSMPLPYKNQFLIIVRHQTVANKIQSLALQTAEGASSPYIFYIIATKKGRLIDDHFPYSTETFTHFKIKLMQIVLNRNPITLYAKKNDLKKIAYFIHTLSDGVAYHYFNAKDSYENSVSAVLFGAQDLFEKAQTDKGLLELCNNGTLVIENIEYLPHQIQVDLAHFLSSGTYLPSKGFHTKISNARIILLKSYDDLQISQPYPIARNLEEALSLQTIYCPQLELISENEYITLIEEIIEKNAPFALSSEQQNTIMHAFLIKRVQSISELEKKIEENLHENKHTSYEKNYYFNNSEETVQKIIAQGKESLQDPQSLRILWNKFDKNQSHIAKLLKVHRSSVSRRVKEYKL